MDLDFGFQTIGAGSRGEFSVESKFEVQIFYLESSSVENIGKTETIKHKQQYLLNRAARSAPGRFGCTEWLVARCCCIYRSHVPYRALFSTSKTRQRHRNSIQKTDER